VAQVGAQVVTQIVVTQGYSDIVFWLTLNLKCQPQHEKKQHREGGESHLRHALPRCDTLELQTDTLK